jgi:alpha-beta hydrolase superfamily lysophospholipase
MIDGTFQIALLPRKCLPAVRDGKNDVSIWPKLSFDNELNSSHLSHDPSVVEAYDNDPFVHRKVSARWFTEFFTAMEKTSKNAKNIHIPILMQVAGDDRLVDPITSKNFFENVTSKDKTLHFYEGLFHEISMTDMTARVLNDLESWLKHTSE